MPQKTPLYKLVQRPYGCKHQLETRRERIQEEGHEMSSQDKVCPLFWNESGDCYRLRNQNAIEELLNDGWKISRVDTMPPTELRDNAVTATNVYTLEREANDD